MSRLNPSPTETRPMDGQGAASLERSLKQVYDLIESGDVAGARARTRDLKQEWPASERVRRLAELLAPPQTRVATPKRRSSFSREQEWLREHATEYPGCWLAVEGSDLVTADPDIKIVTATLEANGKADQVLLHFQPADEIEL